MSLKIRRGTDAERLTITPAEGELIYTTDTKELYIGDGTTVGGNVVTGYVGSGGSGGAGYTGSVGYRGSVGYTGSVGDTGYRGSVGYNGSVGDTGYKGSAGAVGYTGSTPTGGTLTSDLDTSTHNITNGTSLTINGSTGAITATELTTPKLTINNTGIIGTGPISMANNFSPTLSIGSNTQPNTVLQYSDQVLQSYYGIQTGSFGTHFIEHRISRGTLSAPSVSQPGDLSGVTKALGYDGTNYVPFTLYGGIIDPATTVNSNSIGGGFFVSTFKTDGSTSILTFSSTGLLSVPVIKTGSYAGSGVYPSNPSAGMIIFDSNNSHFYGYDGSIWKQLD